MNLTTEQNAGVSIVRIGETADLAAARTVDATGLVVAPGFIDMHAHSDLQILITPDHVAKISQGVTTEVLGQDGLSYAPVDDAALAQVRRQIAGWNGNPADFDFSWRSVGEFLDRLDAGIATNAAYLVPQGTLRLPETLAQRAPGVLTLRVFILNAYGKAYVLDRAYQLAP